MVNTLTMIQNEKSCEKTTMLTLNNNTVFCMLFQNADSASAFSSTNFYNKTKMYSIKYLN